MTFIAPADILEAIAKFVKTTRISQDLRAQDLADRAGVGIATITRIEKTGNCTMENFAKILAAFGKMEIMAEVLKPEETLSLAEVRRQMKNSTRERVRRKRT